MRDRVPECSFHRSVQEVGGVPARQAPTNVRQARVLVRSQNGVRGKDRLPLVELVLEGGSPVPIAVEVRGATPVETWH